MPLYHFFILMDFFEDFQTVVLNLFNFDPAQHYTALGLRWDITLKRINLKLELLTDRDMLI